MAAQKTIGTTLTKTASGAEGEDLVISDLTNIGSFGPESEEIDVTTLDSTGGYRENIGSLIDAGEISFEGIEKTADNSSSLMTLAESQSVEEWTVEWPDGSTAVFDGWVKSFQSTGAEVDGVKGFTGSIRISGSVTFTEASA